MREKQRNSCYQHNLMMMMWLKREKRWERDPGNKIFNTRSDSKREQEKAAVNSVMEEKKTSAGWLINWF